VTLTVDNLQNWEKRDDAGLQVYRLTVIVDSSDISSWDNECANAGKVHVEETAFGNKVAYDTTSSGSDNTVTFSFSTSITGLDNPLTLILKKYSRKQMIHGTNPLYFVEIEGYRA